MASDINTDTRRVTDPTQAGTSRASAAAKAVAADTSALVRAEIELAKAELLAPVKAKGTGIGLAVVAAVLGWLAIQGLLVTAALALALLVPGWAAALIVSGVLLFGAAVLGLAGKRLLATPVTVDATKQNVSADVDDAKQHLRGTPQAAAAGARDGVPSSRRPIS